MCGRSSRVARLLHAMELSAPRILAADIEAGLLLLEDFGDDTYTRLLAAGADESSLYALAVDVLIALNRRFGKGEGGSPPPYDDDKLFTEAALLVDWYLPSLTGAPTAPALREDYLSLWRGLLPLARGVPETLVLRDYHVDNLMRLDGPRRHRRVRPPGFSGRGDRTSELRPRVAARRRAARYFR